MPIYIEEKMQDFHFISEIDFISTPLFYEARLLTERCQADILGIGINFGTDGAAIFATYLFEEFGPFSPKIVFFVKHHNSHFGIQGDREYDEWNVIKSRIKGETGKNVAFGDHITLERNPSHRRNIETLIILTRKVREARQSMGRLG